MSIRRAAACPAAQQKVVLSKWLFTDPEILILDEPTRGIDIGAKYEIYCITNELAGAGKAIIVISSELPELLGICDLICVMNAGVFVGEFERAEATQEKIMRAIMRKGERLVDRDLERKLQETFPGAVHP
jgi:putative multiple sugar transport system ATP-binding protein